VKTLRNKQQKGFTLIELLVVIAIIGLLASVVLLALNSARQKSRDAKRLADVRQIASALELYFNDSTTGYPASLAAMSPTYLTSLPTYPTPNDTGTGQCTASNSTYQYTQGSGGSTYTLMFCISATTGGLAPGTHTLSQGGIQ